MLGYFLKINNKIIIKLFFSRYVYWLLLFFNKQQQAAQYNIGLRNNYGQQQKKKWSHIDIPFMGSYYIPFILNNIHNKYILPCLYDIIIQNTEQVTPFDTFKGHLCIEMTMLLNSCVWQIWIIFKSLLTLWQEFLIFQIVDKAFTDYKRHSLPLSWFGRAVGLYPEQFMHIVEHKR